MLTDFFSLATVEKLCVEKLICTVVKLLDCTLTKSSFADLEWVALKVKVGCMWPTIQNEVDSLDLKNSSLNF